jgi:hypothetical protein
VDTRCEGWQMRDLDERTAGVLLAYMFIIWQYSVDQEAAKGVVLTTYQRIQGGETPGGPEVIEKARSVFFYI